MMPIEAKFQSYVAFVARSRLQIPPDHETDMTLRAIRLRTSVTQNIFTRETCINLHFQFSATTAFATCIIKNLNSYLYVLINGRHTHYLRVPFLFH